MKLLYVLIEFMLYSLKKKLLYIIISSKAILIFGITLDVLKINFTQIYLIKVIIIIISKNILIFSRVHFHFNQFYNLLKYIKI